jgi:hypothetical protein
MPLCMRHNPSTTKGPNSTPIQPDGQVMCQAGAPWEHAGVPYQFDFSCAEGKLSDLATTIMARPLLTLARNLICFISGKEFPIAFSWPSC